MTQEALNKVLEAHKHYLAKDSKGWENMRADLSGANLYGAELYGANLSGANLCGADLRGADLSGADLRSADLSDADLSDADLRSALLRGAYLYNANLSGSDLYNANLSGANLNGANLSGAYLRSAKLRSAKLKSANLCGADLRGADLSGAEYNEYTAFFALSCPEEGDFIAWKKVDDVIIKLRIPAGAKRSSATSRKCRCEYAEVLELQNLDGTPYNDDNVVNNDYVKTIYKVGEIARPDSWDADRWNECSHGIHFFITRDEAVMYNP